MTKTSITILKQSRNSQMGRICKMTSDKGKVHRTAIGFTIPMNDWCPITKRVKSTNKKSSIINDVIQNIISDEIQTQTNYKDCIISYMENELNTGYLNKSIKYNTYKKYNTITACFRNAMKLKNISKITLDDVLDIKKLKDIISAMSINCKPNGKNKTSLNNYLVVFATYVKKWHLENSGKPTDDYSYIHKLAKKHIPGHANYLTSNELEKFKNYVPSGFKKAYTQTITKSIFLSQYYIGGIRISDTLTLSTKQFKADGIQIRMRKNGETRTYPYSYELVMALKPLYKALYDSVINNLELGSLELPATIVAAIIRSGLDLTNYNLEKVNQIILELQSSISIEHKKLKLELEKLSKIIQNHTTAKFFEQIRKLPEGFIFPMLDYEFFKEVLNNIDSLDKDHSYAIQKATTRYNSNLKVISKYLGFNKIFTSHSARHSIALHLMERGATTPIIQDVLGQRNLSSTATYLAQRLPSNNIGSGMGLIHGK